MYHCTIDLLFDWFGLVFFESKNKNGQCDTADSKQEVNGTVILPPLVFPVSSFAELIRERGVVCYRGNNFEEFVFLIKKIGEKNFFWNVGRRKICLGVNFTNILIAAFLYKSNMHYFSVLTVWVCNFWQKDFGAKAAHKMSVKLTPDQSILQKNHLNYSNLKNM